MTGTGGPTPALRWGLIGASTIADEAIIPAIEQTGGEVLAIYSRAPARGRDFANRHRIEAAFTDLDEMLRDSPMDAVFVGTTNDRHHAEVLAAAAAGKHILCEKPIALSVADAREMVRAADAASVVLAVNHQQREQAVIVALRSLIRSGRLGTIRAASFSHAGELREDLRTWRLHNQDAGAGVELDLTVHDADLLRFLIEGEVSEIASLAAREGDAAADTHVMAVLRMQYGLLVSFHQGFDVPFAEPTVQIHGDLATAICIGHTAQVGTGELWLTRDRGASRERIDVGAMTNPYVAAIRAFAIAVANRGRPSADGMDGLRSLQIALGVTEAAATRRTITLDASND